jgi:hypothetical protein
VIPAARRIAIRRVVLGVACSAVVAAAAVGRSRRNRTLTWQRARRRSARRRDRRMNRQFWGVAAKGVLPVLAADARRQNAGRRLCDASPWGWYLKRREIPSTMPDAGHEEAGITNSQYALVIHEKHFNRHDYLVWKIYGTVQPMFVLRSHGVPIVTLYKRPRPRPPAEKP